MNISVLRERGIIMPGEFIIFSVCFFLLGIIIGTVYVIGIQKRHYPKRHRFKGEASEMIHADVEILYADKREQHSNKDY